MQDRKKNPELYLPDNDKPITDMSREELFEVADRLGVIISRKATNAILFKRVKEALDKEK